MSVNHGDPKTRFESDYERKLRTCLDRALICQWKARANAESEPGRLLVLTNRFAIGELFDLMMRGGDDGYGAAAALFACRACDVERPVRARFMTQLARTLHELHGREKGEVRESEVAHFSRFVNALLAKPAVKSRDDRMDGVVLAWVEDMNSADAENDLEPQPTAVIRGVLFAPTFDHRQAFGFWERASRSERFPLRIFSDPCPSEDGAIFSSYHVRAFGLFFAVAPEGAVARFAAHLRDNATAKKVRDWDDAARTWATSSVPASLAERQGIWNGIAGYIDGEQRRERVQSILHAVPEGPKTKAQAQVLIGPANSAGLTPTA